jgi:hypothetical protein
MVTFSKPFVLNGRDGELPAGQYEILVEEELLHGLSFSAYRRTGTYLTVNAGGGRTELRQISEVALDAALAHDRSLLDGQ